MGGDGGVIATQRAFVRGAGKNVEARKDAKNVHQGRSTRASTCALTNEPLQAPLVSCELGNIFNKEALLTVLMEKRLPPDFSHIRGLKDLKTLEFSTATLRGSEGIRVCPITREEFNGQHPFVVLWTSGKVLSERALREIGIDDLQDDYGPFTSADVVKLVPLDSEMDEQRASMHARRSAKKRSTKSQAAASSAPECSSGSSKKRNIDEEADVPQPEPKRRAVGSHPTADGVVRKALDSVNTAQQSDVFKGLFHKDGEKDMHSRDLLMSVAGLRYTIN